MMPPKWIITGVREILIISNDNGAFSLSPLVQELIATASKTKFFNVLNQPC